MQSHFAQLRNGRPIPGGSIPFGSAGYRVESKCKWPYNSRPMEAPFSRGASPDVTARSDVPVGPDMAAARRQALPANL
jgi:hypothetical protein